MLAPFFSNFLKFKNNTIMRELVIFKDGTTGIFYNDSSVSEDTIEFNVERNCYILHNGGDFEWHNNCWMEI